jgi:hypothetical protein
MFDVVDMIMEAEDDVVQLDGSNKSCHVLLAMSAQSRTSARDAVVDNVAVTFGKSCHAALAKSGNSRKSASDADVVMDIMVVNKVVVGGSGSILLLLVVSSLLFQEAYSGTITEIGSSIVSIQADTGLSSAPASSTISSRQLDISSSLFKNDDFCGLLLLAEDAGMDIPAAIAAKGYLFLEAVVSVMLGVLSSSTTSGSSSCSSRVFVVVVSASVILIVILVVDADARNSWHRWTMARSVRAVSAKNQAGGDVNDGDDAGGGGGHVCIAWRHIAKTCSTDSSSNSR